MEASRSVQIVAKIISLVVATAAFGYLYDAWSADLDFQFSLEPIKSADGKAPTVVGGTLADPSKFSATFLFVGDSFCTATVVGRRSVVTSAHCVKSTKIGTIKLGEAVIPLTCKIPRQYSAKDCETNPVQYGCVSDIAMCYASQDLIMEGLTYDQIGYLGVTRKPQIGDNVTLMGYGCIVQGGAPVKSLYVGNAVVDWTPGGHTGPMNNYLGVVGGAVGCKGDSGAGNLDSLDQNSRRIIGISSWINARSKHTYLVPVLIHADFIREWGNDHKTKVCGVHALVPNC